ncbi:MlaD family protein [Jannaschia sp. W003]|uniref:MlaD family protein n=1 Tax=Jannaschia sp. W003 TaxID=2867012 RepID=UPI0021A7AE47|nr:MlaD family protein [Jannaschia sp. W003]UWQ22449.1 MlaD family protein [Jannaschia sp. W003]
MTDPTPHTPVAEPLRRRRGNISAVWLVPMAAVLIALAIAWQAYSNRGVLIAVAFPDASGVTAGETTLRFKEVTVGVVEDVGFSPDLASVNVYIRVSKDIAPFLDEDAAFWVVQPSVSARGVTGLNTILSGTYIQGVWDSEIGVPKVVFAGTDTPPIVPPGVRGTAIVLRAADGARLEAGAPILYRGIEVGEVATPSLSPDGSEVRLDAFIRAPYDRQLSSATRFWDASGVSVALGGSGLELNVGSLAAILEGGVVFDTLISGGQPIDRGHVFDIFDDRDDALASTFEAPTSRAVRFSALFPAAAAGLSEGAPVRFGGVRVGVVTSITGFVRPDDPDGEVQLLAVMAIQPSRMGLESMESDLDGVDFVGTLVERGLRAQLVSTSILGGELAVDLVSVEGGAPAALEVGVADNPVIPSIETEGGSLTATAEGVLSRFNELPIEELLVSATDLLANLNRIAGDEATRAIPSAALDTIRGGEGLLADVRAIVSAPETAAVLLDAQSIAADVAALTARIREREIVATLADTLEGANVAVANVAAGTERLGEIADGAVVLFDEAGRLVSSEAAQALPAAARAALDAGTAVLAAPEIAAILESTAAVTTDIRQLAARIATDAVAERIEGALAGIDDAARNVAEGTADLGTLRAALDGTLEGARALLASADTQAIPGLARETLEGASTAFAGPQLEAILADAAAVAAGLRTVAEGAATPETAAAVAAAAQDLRTVARNVAKGTRDLGDLRASLQSTLDGTEALLASEDTQALPGLARSALQGASDALAAPEIAAILADVAAAASEARAIAEGIDGAALSAGLTEALAAVEATARNVEAGTADLGTLRASIDRAAEGAAAILSSEDTQALPAALRGTLAEATDALAGASDVLAGPEIDAILQDTAAVAAGLRTMAEGVATPEAAARIEASLASIETATENVAAGTADLASLRASLDRAVGGAADILDSEGARALPAAARGLVEDARAILGAPEIQALLADLPLITADIRAITDEIRQAEAAAALTSALAAAEQAATSVADSTQGLPELSASAQRVLAEAEVLAGNLTQLSAKANDLALDELVNATTDLMVTADLFLSSDEAGDVPVVLSNTLEELRRTVETIRTGGALDNLNAALVSAASAAGGIEGAAADLPALLARLQGLSTSATEVLASYNSESRIAQELYSTLRAATRAAEDVSSLSRTIERNPNSLLLGR